jgi:DUF3048 family protein
MADERSLGGVSGAGRPPDLSRQERRRQAAAARRHGRRTWGYLLGGTAAVLVAVTAAALVTDHHQNAARAAVTTTTSPHPAAPAALCPLRGTPAPGGAVPARPALAVKIGNYTGDRPSAGLNAADIVFEEPVEGAITRLVAVFQCKTAPLVGDLRSARQPDLGILSQLSNPIFVHAGGIAPVLSLLANGPLIDKNILAGANESAIIEQPGRYAPYSTFVNAATAWALDPADMTPPAPIFSYGTTLPAGTALGSGGSVHIPFSSSSDVTWQWSPAAAAYLRSYAGVPDILIGGGQTSANNVVAMTVPTAIGSWVENDEGGREVVVTATGSGPLLVLRDGAAIAGTWSRTSLNQPATLTTASGAPITLAPGNTWVELVPRGIPVIPAAVAPAPTHSTASTGQTTIP